MKFAMIAALTLMLAGCGAWDRTVAHYTITLSEYEREVRKIIEDKMPELTRLIETKKFQLIVLAHYT